MTGGSHSELVSGSAGKNENINRCRNKFGMTIKRTKADSGSE